MCIESKLHTLSFELEVFRGLKLKSFYGALSHYSLTLSSSNSTLFLKKRTKVFPREASQVSVWYCHVLEKL